MATAAPPTPLYSNTVPGGVPPIIGGTAGQSNGPTPWTTQSPLGPMYGGELIDPQTGVASRTGAQKGTNAGQALKALQDTTGLNLLGSANFNSGFGDSGVGGTPVPRIGAPDNTAANADIFARAKDTAGQNSRAAITALRGTMAERGMLGSGIEGGETARIVGQAAGGVGDVNREQAIQQSGQANQNQQLGYTGDVTQRGQDLSLEAQRRSLLAQQQARAQQGLLSVFNMAGTEY